MAGSPDDRGLPHGADTVAASTTPVHPETVPSLSGGAPPTFTQTQTQTTAGPRPGESAQPEVPAASPASSTRPREIVRHGPGVPATAAGNEPTAEEVWRRGLPGAIARRRRPLGRRLGPALTVVLFIASIVVIYLRLHHAAFGVTGVAITKQVHSGCAVTLTGEISTTGGAGTVSYEWTFQPQARAPQPLHQPVTGGQTALYVTAALEGQGHGSVTRTATLRTLGPGQASASAPVVISC